MKYAHARGKKVYVTVNIYARNSDLEKMEDYFAFLAESGADAALISDPGVLYAAKKADPRRQIPQPNLCMLWNKIFVALHWNFPMTVIRLLTAQPEKER